jgi:hypothetical protein
MQNTGMPINEGRSGMSTPFTGRLAEHQEMIIDAGINLFEIQKSRINPMGTQDFGYFDVVIGERIGANERIERSVEWRMGQQAYIKYFPEKRTGLCYGFAPDDPWWHNRIMLASNIKNGEFLITRYITQQGLISGNRITDEIRFIEDHIHDWKVTIGKDVKFRSKDVLEIRRVVTELVEKGMRPQTIYSKIPEIEKIISIYKQRWISSPDFQQKFLPKMKEAIAEKFKAETDNSPIDFKKELFRVFRELTPQERLELMAEADNSDKPKSAEGKKINELTEEEALRVARKTYHINTDGMDLHQVHRAISEAAGLKFDLDDEDPAGNVGVGKEAATAPSSIGMKDEVRFG